MTELAQIAATLDNFEKDMKKILEISSKNIPSDEELSQKKEIIAQENELHIQSMELEKKRILLENECFEREKNLKLQKLKLEEIELAKKAKEKGISLE